jgi:hypothetical protein
MSRRLDMLARQEKLEKARNLKRTRKPYDSDCSDKRARTGSESIKDSRAVDSGCGPGSEIEPVSGIAVMCRPNHHEPGSEAGIMESEPSEDDSDENDSQ